MAVEIWKLPSSDGERNDFFSRSVEGAIPGKRDSAGLIFAVDR